MTTTNPRILAAALLSLALSTPAAEGPPRRWREDPWKKRHRGHVGTKASIGKRKADRRRRENSR